MYKNLVDDQRDLPIFHLNMQILADEILLYYSNTDFFRGKDPAVLDGIRFYQKNRPLSRRYVYLITASQVTGDLRALDSSSFIVAGKADPENFSESSTVLIVGEEEDLPEIFSLAQQIFEKYHDWDRQLQLALNSTNPLEDMLEASLPVFNNPIFCHDTNFYILSCPRNVQGMSIWEREPRTGRYMVPLSLIHDFKIDLEYLKTLETRGPDIFSADMRGYRILYVNIWVNGRYEGRLCVDELQSLLTPGHFLALQYLGTFIELCIARHNIFRLALGDDASQFFSDYLDGKITDSQLIQDFLHYSNWKVNDHYVCLRLEAEQQNENMHSAVATLGHIELQIQDSHAFIYQQGIVVIANLAYAGTISDILSSLSILLREGLFKMGASSELHNFNQLSQGYHQACEALRLGKRSPSMTWCYRFHDYLLEYILEQSSRQFAPELLCSQKLLILKEYDAANHTEFYRTLRTYLLLERNVLQTAKELFIHRSTLFYRLERIQKIAKINFDDPKERLILQLSFCFLDQQLLETQ